MIQRAYTVDRRASNNIVTERNGRKRLQFFDRSTKTAGEIVFSLGFLSVRVSTLLFCSFFRIGSRPGISSSLRSARDPVYARTELLSALVVNENYRGGRRAFSFMKAVPFMEPRKQPARDIAAAGGVTVHSESCFGLLRVIGVFNSG